MLEIGKKLDGVEAIEVEVGAKTRHRGAAQAPISGMGIPSQWGWGLGRELCTVPRKFWDFFSRKLRILVHFSKIKRLQCRPQKPAVRAHSESRTIRQLYFISTNNGITPRSQKIHNNLECVKSNTPSKIILTWQPAPWVKLKTSNEWYRPTENTAVCSHELSQSFVFKKYNYSKDCD